MRDDRMADIQLDDAVDRRDLLDVRVVQTVTRIDLDAERDAQLHATHHALEFALLLAGVVRFRVAAGVKLDHERSRIMICGNPEMVDDIRHHLQNTGYRVSRRGEPGHMAVENYW